MSGQTLVVKIGGSTLGHSDTSLADLVVLQNRGVRVIVVHGGGGEVSRWSSRLGLPTQFVDGLRVTDAESLPVVAAILAGLVNKHVVLGINSSGGRAVGLSGVDAGLVTARINNPALGFVGEISHVEPAVLGSLLDSGFLPVVSPICWGTWETTPTLLNVNADDVAIALAVAVSASSLVFLTDVPGILDADGTVLPRLTVAETEGLIDDGTIRGGMIPKARACIEASRHIAQTRIIDGTVEHALLREFEDNPGGTSIVGEQLA